jgi:signal transduction histidine kinase
MLAEAKKITVLANQIKPSDLYDYLDHISGLGYRLFVYDEAGNRIYAHSEEVHLKEDAILQVLRGEDYWKLQESIKWTPDIPVAGVPFPFHGKEYALFLQPQLPHPVSEFYKVAPTLLLTVLAVGSLLTLVASRYVVKPLQVMTHATQRLASGDFRVRLNLKRRDELGTLAVSFNRMADALERLEQMRREFVSDVSHEIQSPLTSMRGFAKALQEEGITETERKEYAAVIQQESERLSRLSDQLLQLASLDSEHHPFHPRPIRLDEHIRQVIVSSEPQWSAKAFTWDLDLPATTVIGDKDQLQQVWTNLLDNAIKFTPSGGNIRIQLSQEASFVRILLSDTGIGMSETVRQRIFDRFYKGDDSRSGSGSGIGLALVKKIIERHGGTITVRSREGEGSTFVVTLPLEGPAHP